METIYYRKKNVIQGTAGRETFSSINAAKRKSRELQTASGQLGSGLLRVIDKLPTLETCRA